MATTPTPQGGVDYNQYPSWEKVTAPNGATYYVVPGTAYLYDPFLSSQKGRPVLFQDPRAAYNERQKQIKAQERAQSPAGQILPVIGSTVAGVGGIYAANQLTKDSPVATPTTTTTPTPTAGSAATQAAAASGSTSIRAVGPAAMPDGSAGVAMSDGSVVSTGSGAVITPDGTQVINGTAHAPDGSILTGQNAAKAIGYAAAIYTAYNTYKNRDKLTSEQEAAGYAQAGLGAYQAAYGASAALSGIGGALNIYGTYSDENLTAEQQASRAQQQAGAAALDYFVFPGAGTALDAALQSTGIGRKLSEIDQKFNPGTKLLASFGSSKSGEQMARDRVRKKLEEIGVINQEGNKDWQLKFSDGGTFDLGKDGGAKLTNAAGEERQYSDVDFADPRAGSVVGSVNPLAAILTGGQEKLRSDFAGEYTNAVLAGQDDPAVINRRIQELYAKHNLNQQDALTAVDNLEKDKKIDATTAAAYRNGLGQVFAGTAYNGPQPLPQAPGTPAQAATQSAMQISKPVGAVGPQGEQLLNMFPPGMKGAGVPVQNPQQAAFTTVPTRSSTVSPGIGLNGQRLTPAQMGQELARRHNARA